MCIQIRFKKTGGPEVLEIERTAVLMPGPGEVWIEQKAIGVNYLDITQRKGAVAVSLPSGIGLEAAGVVTSIGPGLPAGLLNKRVAYVLGPIGAYASGRLYPADRLIDIPESVSFEEAATVLFKGITAHYLLHSTYPVAPGTIVLSYGATGALGRIMTPWAKALGAFVIGIVSKPADETRARELGCDQVFVWGSSDLIGEVKKLTHGEGAHVVYDGLGKLTFDTSLNCLRRRGLMVSFGASTGVPDPVSVNTLSAKGSLFLTRPTLAAHATEISEYRERADAVFQAVASGTFKVATPHEFPLIDAAEAHAAMEKGALAGAVVLKA